LETVYTIKHSGKSTYCLLDENNRNLLQRKNVLNSSDSILSRLSESLAELKETLNTTLILKGK